MLNLQRRGKFSIRALHKLAALVREHDVGTLVAMNLYPALYAVLHQVVVQESARRG